MQQVLRSNSLSSLVVVVMRSVQSSPHCKTVVDICVFQCHQGASFAQQCWGHVQLRVVILEALCSRCCCCCDGVSLPSLPSAVLRSTWDSQIPCMPQAGMTICFLCFLCVPIAIPAIFLVCSCVVVFTAAVSLTFLPVDGMWLQRDGKRRREGDGWRKPRWKKYWPRLSSLKVERSGPVVTAQRGPCGQGRNIEGARQTFH